MLLDIVPLLLYLESNLLIFMPPPPHVVPTIPIPNLLQLMPGAKGGGG